MVKKGVKKENIKIITSHPQPIGQCSKLLSHEFADVKIEFADSTASAAKRVKESDGSVACIGSPNSAKIYDLDILCHDCGDDANNSTRFVIIEKTRRKNYYGYYKFKLKKEVFKTSFFNISHFSNCMIREIYRKMYSVLLYQVQSKLTHHQYCRLYQ